MSATPAPGRNPFVGSDVGIHGWAREAEGCYGQEERQIEARQKDEETKQEDDEATEEGDETTEEDEKGW